jgi:hypothetical protein
MKTSGCIDEVYLIPCAGVIWQELLEIKGLIALLLEWHLFHSDKGVCGFPHICPAEYCKPKIS